MLGPVLGAVILAWSGWRAIFWANVFAGLILYAAGALSGTRSLPALPVPHVEGANVPPPISRPAGAGDGAAPARSRRVGVAWVLAGLGLALGGLALAEPEALISDVTLGLAFVPFVGDSPLLTADRGRCPGAPPDPCCRHRSTVVGGAAPGRPPRGTPGRHRTGQSRPHLCVVRSGEGGGRTLGPCAPAARSRRTCGPPLVARARDRPPDPPARPRPAWPALGARQPRSSAPPWSPWSSTSRFWPASPTPTTRRVRRWCSSVSCSPCRSAPSSGLVPPSAG